MKSPFQWEENNPFVIITAPPPSAARCSSGECPKMVKNGNTGKEGRSKRRNCILFLLILKREARSTNGLKSKYALALLYPAYISEERRASDKTREREREQ